MGQFGPSFDSLAANVPHSAVFVWANDAQPVAVADDDAAALCSKEIPLCVCYDVKVYVFCVFVCVCEFIDGFC